MDDRHLTDDEIQDYLDTRLPELAGRVEKHTASCDKCKSMLKDYASLYSGLSDDTGFELSDDFTNGVVASIHKNEREPFLSRFGNQILAATGIAAAVAALVMLPDIALISSFISRTSALLESSLVRTFEHTSASAGGTLGLILPGAFALLAMWILDRHVIHAKKKPSSLMI